MATNAPVGVGGGGSSSTLPVRPGIQSDYFSLFCRVFSFITVMAAALCITFNLLAAVQSFKNVSSIFDGIFRCYVVWIGMVVVVVQAEWEVISNFRKALECWAGRGLLQIFFAVMTRAYPQSPGEKKELVRLQIISSYMLLSCGFIYFISGLLCTGCLNRARLKEISREKAEKDLEDLERSRAELLQALLI